MPGRMVWGEPREEGELPRGVGGGVSKRPQGEVRMHGSTHARSKLPRWPRQARLLELL